MPPLATLPAARGGGCPPPAKQRRARVLPRRDGPGRRWTTPVAPGGSPLPVGVNGRRQFRLYFLTRGVEGDVVRGSVQELRIVAEQSQPVVATLAQQLAHPARAVV